MQVYPNIGSYCCLIILYTITTILFLPFLVFCLKCLEWWIPLFMNLKFLQIIAAGPFTTTDNLLFEPLTDLLAYAKRKQPQVLILVRNSVLLSIVSLCSTSSFADAREINLSMSLTDRTIYWFRASGDQESHCEHDIWWYVSSWDSWKGTNIWQDYENK